MKESFYRRFRGFADMCERMVAPPMPQAVIGQHIVIDFKKKKLKLN